MIDEEKTFIENGVIVDELMPHSNKKVYAICDGCGNERWLRFRDYRSLCLKCVRRMSRKHDYDDKDIIRNIDEEKTFVERGVVVSELSAQSAMDVYAICTDCGTGRWVEFRDYRDLCLKCAHKKMRKYNYDDYESIIRNIDEEKTFVEKGYRSTDLSAQSHKEVWAVCVDCGNGRWIEFCQYRDLCSNCILKGENRPNWKGGITPENEKFRNSLEYADWRKAVFDRDNYTCQECGDSTGGNLNAHHILPIRDWREPRFSLNIKNGITLCEKCHRKTLGNEYEFFNKYFDIANGVVSRVKHDIRCNSDMTHCS